MTNEASTSPPPDCINAWLVALSKVVGVTFRMTEYITMTLVRRANYVRNKARSLKGGLQRRKFFSLEWKFRVPAVDVQTLDSLRSENKQLSKKVETLETELKASADMLRRVCDGKRGRGRSRTNSIDDYSARQQSRIKRQRTMSCTAALQWMNKEGYRLTKVIAINAKNEEEVITLNKDIDSAVGETLVDEDRDILSMMIYVKDRFSVSGNAYHEMAKVCKALPRHYKIKQKIAELNQMWDIKPTPPGIIGVQQALEPRLRSRILQLEKNTPEDAPFKCNSTVRVKLSGDSTNMGKRIQVENFTYTLLDEGERAYSYEACHPLAMFKAPEKYNSLKLALKDVIHEVTELKMITVGKKKYSIEYYLGGDWKFLAMVTGKLKYYY